MSWCSIHDCPDMACGGPHKGIDWKARCAELQGSRRADRMAREKAEAETALVRSELATALGALGHEKLLRRLHSQAELAAITKERDEASYNYGCAGERIGELEAELAAIKGRINTEIEALKPTAEDFDTDKQTDDTCVAAGAHDALRWAIGLAETAISENFAKGEPTA